MNWQLVHTTEYVFTEEVLLGPHEVRLCPRSPFSGQHRLTVWPEPGMAYARHDAWQSPLLQLWFPRPTRQLRLTNRLRFRSRPVNPFHFTVEKASLHYPPQPLPGLERFLEVRPQGPAFAAWVQEWQQPGSNSVNLAGALNAAIHDRISYAKREESGWQSPEETLLRARGTCRDTAWLLVQTLRALGYPARYVSGYWVQVEGASAELHAWAEFYLPGAGWLGLDPTAGLFVAHQHVALCHAPDPEGTLPVQGTHSGSTEPRIEFCIKVRRSR